MINKIKQRTIIYVLVIVGVFTVFVKAPMAFNNIENRSVQSDYASLIDTYNKKISDAKGQKLIYLLLQRGEAYRALGYYLKAKTDFNEALDKAKAENLQLLEIIATQSLGYIYFLQQKLTLAKTLLNSAFKTVKTLNHPVLAATCANRLGNILYRENRLEKARDLYMQALKFIQKIKDPNLAAIIYRNLARIEKHNKDGNKAAFHHLITAEKIAQTIKSSFEQANILTAIAVEAKLRDPDNKEIKFRYDLLSKALLLAVKLDSIRLISVAAGEMGKLYEIRNKFKEALALTEQAMDAAQTIDANELLLQWEWQRGRILNDMGQRKKAIAAFWRAVYHIQVIDQDITINYSNGCSSFRKTLSPIYLGLADMLFAQSKEESDDIIKQDLLKQAQQAIESIKQSQLKDYFKDPCIAALSRKIESLSPKTAVIYPIIFPDRLELLADIGGKLHHKTTIIKKEVLEPTVVRLSSNLRNNSFYKKLSHIVFSWLITPLESLLVKNKVDTLIFVPDGVFRMLPIAVLYNDDKFLIEKYAIATQPGLSLLDPKPMPRGDMKTLLAGVSKPGPVVLDLPKNLWDTLSQTSLRKVNRAIRSFPVVKGPVRNASESKIVHHSKENAAEHIKQILDLPGVDKEIETLSQNLDSQVLLNKDFLLNRFSKEISDKNKNYRIVHIASHGYFGGSPEENFIITYDKLLSMNILEEYIKPKQLVKQPVELITLSACQTAEGDEQSPLGLSGVALKSGARSVIGSLWPVSDEATQELLSDFYMNFKNVKNSKAQALQQAQIKLIKEKKFHHPFYWSAFILVGNWL